MKIVFSSLHTQVCIINISACKTLMLKVGIIRQTLLMTKFESQHNQFSGKSVKILLFPVGPLILLLALDYLHEDTTIR